MLAWGRANFAPYPWRSRRTRPWHALSAEVLLQRTRAEQVASVYSEFVRRYPDPECLVREKPGQLREVIGSLGLHWRMPLIVQLAEKLKTSGEVPSSLEELKTLPGVGPYAASAYLSMHRDVRALIIDSNVVRWLGRVLGVPTDPETRRKAWLRDVVDTLTPKRAFRDFNYAMLDLSMKVCRPRPECARCPLPATLCAYRRESLGQPRASLARRKHPVRG